MVYKQQILVSQSSCDWELEDEGINRLCGKSCFLVLFTFSAVKGWRIFLLVLFFVRAVIECFPSFQDLLAPKVTCPEVITISTIHSNHSFPTEFPQFFLRTHLFLPVTLVSHLISTKSQISRVSSKYVNQLGIRLNYNLS